MRKINTDKIIRNLKNNGYASLQNYFDEKTCNSTIKLLNKILKKNHNRKEFIFLGSYVFQKYRMKELPRDKEYNVFHVNLTYNFIVFQHLFSVKWSKLHSNYACSASRFYCRIVV